MSREQVLNKMINKRVARKLACDYLMEVGLHLHGAPGADKPNEKLMRAVEETGGVTEMGADDFRRQVVAYVATQYMKNGPVESTMPPQVLNMCEKYVEKTQASVPERLRTIPKFVVEIEEDEQGND